MARNKTEIPAPYFGPGRKPTGPQFMPSMTEMPSRDEMLTALESAIDATLFKVRYLSNEGLTCVYADMGGMKKNVFDIYMALRAAGHLAAMYDALNPDEPPAEGADEDEKAKENAAT